VVGERKEKRGEDGTVRWTLCCRILKKGGERRKGKKVKAPATHKRNLQEKGGKKKGGRKSHSNDLSP